MLLTLRLYVLYGSHNKQRLVPYTALANWFCITKVESVYCTVHTESLYKTDTFSLFRVIVNYFIYLVALFDIHKVKRGSNEFVVFGL